MGLKFRYSEKATKFLFDITFNLKVVTSKKWEIVIKNMCMVVSLEVSFLTVGWYQWLEYPDDKYYQKC